MPPHYPHIHAREGDENNLARTTQGRVGGIVQILAIGGIGRRDWLANDGLGDQAGIGPDLVLDFVRHINIFGQELLGVFPALADPLIAI